jgi:hypothetical protein
MGNFYTDVVMHDPRFGSTVRIADPFLLEPVTRDAVLKISQAAASMGLPVMIFETYRSQARQQLLFDQGATKLQKVGVHGFGLAADLVRVVAGEPSWKVDYSFLGPLAKQFGLIWGGDWGAPGESHTFVDSDHVQRVTLAQQDDLFAGVWYPDEVNPDGQVVA